MKGRLLSSVLAGALAASIAPAFAQNTETTANSEGVGEVIVTAQRREERLQDVPLAVTAVTAESLEALGAMATTDLKLASPSVDTPLTAGFLTPYIRGVGTRAVGPGIESPVAVYMDGVYIGAQASGLIQFDNIERVEVLKGPQGTLFGRNTTGGLIQVVTRDPQQDFSGRASVTYGNYDTSGANFYVTGGVSDNVAADLALYGKWQGDGYGTNLATGNDVYRTDHDYGARSVWLVTPSDNVELRFAIDYSQFESSQSAQRVALNRLPLPALSAPYGGSAWDTSLSTEPLITNEQGGVSLRANVDLGGMQFVSTTAYREAQVYFQYDMDVSANAFGSRSFYGTQNDRQFSQEFQLMSGVDAPFDWTLGLFYWKARGEYSPYDLVYTGFFTGGGTFSGFHGDSGIDTESIAPYAQATFEVFADTNLTLGARYIHEERSIDGFIYTADMSRNEIPGSRLTQADPEQENNETTYRVSLDHNFTDDLMVYGSVNRGFKSGGYSTLAPDAAGYEPEWVTAYEAGFKSQWFDNRLRLNGAAFFYDYTDVQVYYSTISGLQTKNGGEAEVKGFELELEARPTSNLTLSAAYTHLANEWTYFPDSPIFVPDPLGGGTRTIGDVAGNDLANSPEHAVTLAGSYVVPMGDNELTFNANYYYSSGYYGEPDNVAEQDAYNIFNASVEWATANDGLTVTLWGKNLTDEEIDMYPSHTNVARIANVTYTTQRSTFAPPMTFGVTVGTRF